MRTATGHPFLIAGTVLLLVACSSEEEDGEAQGGTLGAGARGAAGASSGPGSGAAGPGVGGGSTGPGAGGTAGSGGSSASASDWILATFADVEVVTGDFTERTMVETPALVRDATGCCAKYAFDLRNEVDPVDLRAGFVNVTITDLQSSDAFGGGITTGYAPGVVLFLDEVHIEPNWPEWVDYQTTNYDGMVLDDSVAIYAEDLTVANWNADGAIDNKAPTSQFVRLTIEGQGNRGIRYWGNGPHYLVDSHLNNAGNLGEGTLLWFSDCDATTVRIYASTFNGSATVPGDMIGCDNGSAPQLEYLTTDPRTTGEMHEMFSP